MNKKTPGASANSKCKVNLHDICFEMFNGYKVKETRPTLTFGKSK